jgi:hypothetical protein
MDDAALLQRARRGDDAAFSELFERHQRAIYRYAVYMCGPEGGDDIVQETFMAVLKQSVRHDLPAAGVRAYLLGIARHRVLKWNRVDAWPAPASTRHQRSSNSLTRRRSRRFGPPFDPCLRPIEKCCCSVSCRKWTTRQQRRCCSVRSERFDRG